MFRWHGQKWANKIFKVNELYLSKCRSSIDKIHLYLSHMQSIGLLRTYLAITNEYIRI